MHGNDNAQKSGNRLYAEVWAIPTKHFSTKHEGGEGGCIVNTFHHIRTRMGDLDDLYNTAMKWGTPRWFLFSSIKQLNIVWLSENFNRQTVHKKINIVLYTFIGNSQQWYCMKCDEINIDIHNKHKHMTENDHQTQFGYDSYTTITRILFFVHLN